jgi:hypothetical protein
MYRMQLVHNYLYYNHTRGSITQFKKSGLYWNMWHVLNEVNKMTCRLDLDASSDGKVLV